MYVCIHNLLYMDIEVLIIESIKKVIELQRALYLNYSAYEPDFFHIRKDQAFEMICSSWQMAKK